MANWKKLLSPERLRPEDGPEQGDEGNDFISDYYRVVFASAFRRLQDKTQVSPLAETDYVRRRLTHSVEVAVVGERMGRVLGNRLEDRFGAGDVRDAMGKIVATACLLHDIGNPPFGHEGELAVRIWADRSAPACPDYRCFDGNAQGFRIAVRLQHLGKQYGMNLTAATLASMLKYPNIPRLASANAANVGKRGKWSVMSSERSHYEQVANLTGLKLGQRHPLSFVVEAADDIVNRLVDVEDAIKLNLIQYSDVCDVLASVNSSLAADLLNGMQKRIAASTVGTRTENQLWTYQSFRVKATAALSKACEDVFVSRINDLEDGSFTTDLIAESEHAELYGAIKALEYSRIFDDAHIVRVEAGGKRAIAGLLDIFLAEVVDDSKLSKTVPIPLHADCDDEDEFGNVRRVVDYVSGMTDRYAIDLYQELSGISL